MSEQQPWERMEGEPGDWYARFHAFMLAGPNRSIRSTYLADAPRNAKRRQDSGIPKNWYEISAQWDWKKRATAWDESIHEEQEAEVKRIMTEGYAAAHERVQAMNEIAEQLHKRLKAVKAKDRYPVMVLEQWRGLLDDLAQETGGRVKKQDITSAGEKLDGFQVIFYMPETKPEEGYNG